MTTQVDQPTRASVEHETVTVRRLREVIAHLPGDTPLIIGIRDRYHVDTLLFDVPVHGLEVTRGPNTPVLVLDAAGIS